MGAEPAEAPLRFGRYEVLFHIASGGMAEVFAARLPGPGGFEKLVAVKRLLPSLSAQSFVDMFHDEARLTSQIASPHVVPTLELGQDDEDGALFIVMELVVGVTLFDLCVHNVNAGAMLPVPVVVEVLSQASQGLHDAHNARTSLGEPLKVVHRDVSPQNILVGRDGRVRVMDFGIARAVSRASRTRVGQVKGKVAYLSPEQSRGESLDHRSDVFSLGIVAWEALTGRSLFHTDSPQLTAERLREMPIPSPATLRDDVPEEVGQVVLWALERDPARRCPTAAEFARALRRACSGSGATELGRFVRDHGGPALDAMQESIKAHQQGKARRFGRPESSAVAGGPERLVPQASLSRERSLTAIVVPGTSSKEEAWGGQRELPTDLIPRPKPPGGPKWLLVFGGIAWCGALLLLWWLWSRPIPEEGPAIHLPAGREGMPSLPR